MEGDIISLLEAIEVKKIYQIRTLLGRHTVNALSGVNLTVPKDSVVAIVGESGSGKSTLARLLLGLEKPDSGRIIFMNQDIWTMDNEQRRAFRRAVSVIFQDPFASLNPRMNVYSIVSEPLKVHRICARDEIKDRVVDLLRSVELSEEHLNRYPHEFSGGQRQRICIARALALEPQILIADEPLSALDVSVQAQIINLLQDIKDRRSLSIVLISHDLEIVHYLADYVYIIYQGRVVEEGPTEALFHKPFHPYTKILLEAVPKIKGPRGKRKKKITAEVLSRTEGCFFYERCPERKTECTTSLPELKKINSRKVRCFLY